MKKRVLSALLALCLTLSLAGAAFAENEASGASSSAASQAVSSVEPESQAQDKTVSSSSASGEDQTSAKTESTPASTQTPAASDVTEEEPESTVAPEATEEPEVTAEPDATPTPTEDPVADVTENEESDGSVEYTAALETDGETMNVIVTAPEGAFAEGVQPKLSVTMLTAEDELNAVADKLKNAEVQYDGFTALDITFTDKATGEEVEPVKSVAVRIELPQAMVDSGIDLTTLAVQHLEEDENGNVQNVTEVATLDNGITLSEEAAAAANEAAGVAPMSNMPAEEATAGDATETPAAVAEFEVDGFSSFVITWNGPKWKEAFEITFKYVDENGNEIDAPNVPQNNTYSGDQNYTRIDFSDYVRVIEGYTYKETRYQNWEDTDDENNGGIATYLTVTRTQNSDKWRTTYTYTLNVYNENDKLNTSSNTWTWKDFKWPDTKERTIYLIYTKDETTTPGGEGGDQGGTTVTNATVTTTKTADLRDDGSGNYDLTLSISGDRGSSSKKQKVDILFILDKSGSMNYSLNKDVDAGPWESSRMGLLQEAVSNLVDTVEQNDSIDARYGAVAFARSQQRQSESWTDASSIKAFVENLNPGGGTNYQQGIYDGEQLLNGKRAGALTFVIFVSDGEPTYRGIDVDNSTSGSDSSLSDTGNGRNDENGFNIEAAITEISNLTCDYFYAIGMGPEFGQDKRGDDKTGTKNLKNLANAVQATSKGDNNVFSASATDTLEQAFKDIAASVIFFAANDVTITDPLSQYADLVLTNGAPQFTITVTREASEGVEKESWSGTVGPNGKVTFHNAKGEPKQATARVSYDNRTIYMDLPDDYELEPGYTYSISTVITPSETAKDLGMNNPKAQKTPDDNTGTHSVLDKDGNKQQGFWSNDNDNAKVTFTANGEPGAQAFPKPVIQVTEEPTGSLKIVKDVQGIDDSDVVSVVGRTTFTFQLEKVIPVEGSNDEYTLDDAFTDSTLGFTGGVKDNITITGKGQSNVISGLPEGRYRVTETNTGTVDADSDYEFVSNNGPVVVEVTKDNTSDAPVEATITNTYKHKDKILTVKKIVAGTMATDGDTFNFTLALTDKNGNPYTGEIPENNKLLKGTKDGEYTFTLTGKMTTPDSLDITLPYNVCATVTEAEAEGYTKVEHREYATGTDPENFAGGSGSDKVTMSQNKTIEFRNTKDLVGPPTGLERNDTPYALMISVAVMAGLALVGGTVVRRRRRWME